jgi:gelsolin
MCSLAVPLRTAQLEKRVREHAGDRELAWENAGSQPGLQIWRIEKFKVVVWERVGSFYDGDSYIILHVSTL